jgi:hypothetical protein
MMLESTFLCEKAIIDTQTQKMSLINIIPANITPAGMPMYLPTITFVVVLCKDNTETLDVYNAILKITNNDKVLIDSPVSIIFSGTKNCNTIIELQNGLMVNEIGTVRFELTIKDVDISIEHKINFETKIEKK